MTARRLRAELRDRGARVPRGPRPSTAADPTGLTARQREVLALLAEGLSNAEIAGPADPVGQDRRPPRVGGAGQARRPIRGPGRRRSPAGCRLAILTTGELGGAQHGENSPRGPAAGASSVRRMTTSLALDGLKARQQKTWSSGDYGAVAALIQPISEALVQAADLSAGSRVLDVATGTGNAAHRRRPLPVRGDRRRLRARAAGPGPGPGRRRAPDVKFVEARRRGAALRRRRVGRRVLGRRRDVRARPGADRRRADPGAAGPGGTIALANWTPDGFIGELFRTVGRRVPPPPGVRAPGRVGQRAAAAGAVRRPGHRAAGRPARDFVFRFASPEAFADYFRAHYGPTLKAFEALDEDDGKLLYADLVELATRHNVATDGTAKIPSAYAKCWPSAAEVRRFALFAAWRVVESGHAEAPRCRRRRAAGSVASCPVGCRPDADQRAPGCARAGADDSRGRRHLRLCPRGQDQDRLQCRRAGRARGGPARAARPRGDRRRSAARSGCRAHRHRGESAAQTGRGGRRAAAAGRRHPGRAARGRDRAGRDR